MSSPAPARIVEARRFTAKQLAGYVLLFVAIASVCAIPRFGQRENEESPVVSDSDFYIDMAHVFLGQSKAFNAEYMKYRGHHYQRPLFPWLAGYTSEYVLGGNLRAAFSLIDLVSATLLATLLLVWMKESLPDERFVWLPSVLFLTAFPQMDWGYHILSDTIGYATAFAAAFYAVWVIRRMDDESTLSSGRRALHLAGLFAVSSIAFLARETGWFAVITAAYVACAAPGSWSLRLRRAVPVAMLALGVIPRMMYTQRVHATSMPVMSTRASLLDPLYMLDVVVKTGVAFNFCWIVALGAAVMMLRKREWGVPDWISGWTIAAILYIGAAYSVNTMDIIGYPLRISFALFPLVFWMVRKTLVEWVRPVRQMVSVAGFCVFQYLVNLFGVTLDSGKGKMTIVDFGHRLLHVAR